MKTRRLAKLSETTRKLPFSIIRAVIPSEIELPEKIRKLPEALKGWVKQFYSRKPRPPLPPPSAQKTRVVIRKKLAEAIERHYGEEQAKQIYGMLLRCREIEDHKSDPTLYSDIDFERGNCIHGDYLIVRDQHGPLGRHQIEVVLFHNPQSKIFVAVEGYRKWRRYLTWEEINLCGAWFSKLQKIAQHK